MQISFARFLSTSLSLSLSLSHSMSHFLFLCLCLNLTSSLLSYSSLSVSLSLILFVLSLLVSLSHSLTLNIFFLLIQRISPSLHIFKCSSPSLQTHPHAHTRTFYSLRYPYRSLTRAAHKYFNNLAITVSNARSPITLSCFSNRNSPD